MYLTSLCDHFKTIHGIGIVSGKIGMELVDTVDGKNPAPVEVGSFSPLFAMFHTSQVVIARFLPSTDYPSLGILAHLPRMVSWNLCTPQSSFDVW